MKPVRTLSLLVLAAALLVGARASADVTIFKTDTWELFTTGRVNGFVVHGWGDANPQALYPSETIIPGGGLDVGSDSIPSGTTDPERNGHAGHVQQLANPQRLPSRTSRSRIANAGEREREDAGVSVLWTTIGTQQQRKTGFSYPDAREGYVKLDGRWGSLLVGRALDLFSRVPPRTTFSTATDTPSGTPATSTTSVRRTG